MRTLASIEGLGKIVEVVGAFDVKLQELEQAAEEAGVKLKTPVITPRDEAYARIKTKDAKQIGRNYGTWTTSGFEYAKGELPVLTRESRLLNLGLAEQAVIANRNEEYFHTNTTQEYDEARKIADKEIKQGKKPNERTVLVLPSRENFRITPKENWHVLEFLLQDQAKPYFDLHEIHSRKSSIPVCLVDKDTVDAQTGTLMTVLWFSSLDGWSGLDGDYRDLLYGDGRARGVFEKTSEAGSRPRKTPKIKLPYTQRESPYTQREVVAQLKRLEEIAEFLERLKQ